jgi:hypothetical protein
MLRTFSCLSISRGVFVSVWVYLFIYFINREEMPLFGVSYPWHSTNCHSFFSVLNNISILPKQDTVKQVAHQNRTPRTQAETNAPDV